MHVSNPLRHAALVAASAVALATLASAAPAQAAPVFSDPDSYVYGSNSSHDDGSCSYVETNGNSTSTPVVENGPATTYSTSASSTHTGTGSDTATGSSQSTATVSIKSANGLPTSLDFTGSGSAAATFAQTTTDCFVHSYAGINAYAKFTLTQPGVMHLTTKGTGKGVGGQVEVYADVDDSYAYVSGSGSRFNGSAEVFLPAGVYWFYANVEPQVSSNVNKSISGSVSAHIGFSLAGSQTAAVSGKAKKYVTLPSARSCATHSINASVIGKKKRADQIKQVSVFVNDAKVKKVKTPDKGDAVTIPVADDQAADVRAEVTLFPSKKGKPGKVVQVTASYEACS
jgi:hypothetical protein